MGATRKTTWLFQTSRKRVLLGAACRRLEHSPTVLCFAAAFIARGNGLLTQEAFGVLAHEYCKNSTYILASLFVAAVFMSPFSSLFRFCFCYLILLK